MCARKVTQLTYRGVPYCKESEAEQNRQWWNLAHRVTLWLTYRGHTYRPCQTGGLIPCKVKN